MTFKIKNTVIIIVSQLDIAGMNMRASLLEYGVYQEEIIESVPDIWPDGTYYLHKNDQSTILTIPADQIHSDYLADHLEADLVIFASKHSAKSGQKALLVHTTGIFGMATIYGGRDQECARAPPIMLTKAYYYLIKARDEALLGEYIISIEVTHHGPSALQAPLIYMETGGTEAEWRDTKACAAVAKAISWMIDEVHAPQKFDKLTFVGIGGTHYGATFQRQLDREEYYMGHIIPKYNHKELCENQDMLEKAVTEAWDKTMAEEKIFLIDKKGCSGAHRNQFVEMIESLGYPWKYG
ncbi:MAG: hypothetical protein INQ03_18565 [Candidatus Heimdallarchaeota archaeon]|nr:hypothetical protein [Candidatus Heimdallarchaeota archaeon]